MPTLILSDLHLGPGRDKTGQWSPTEDFFADDAFAAFLDHYVRANPRVRPHNPRVRPRGDTETPAPSPSPLVFAGDTFSLAETDNPHSNLDIETEAAHRLH